MEAADLVSGRRWLDEFGPHAVVFAHGDPDGLAAGALLGRRTGGGVRFDDPFAVSLPDPPAADVPRVIADQGVRPVATAAPLLFVDHHAGPEPVSATVVWEERAGATSLLAWRLLGEPPEAAWLAALGLIGDLGERGLRDSGLRGAGPAAPLRRLATLCSASGRLRGGPLATAAAILAAADSAAAALAAPEIAQLDEARQEVERRRREAARIAPRVGPGAALIELDVPARVHSQVASAWARRLAPRPVVVANRGWRDGRVSFAVRSADGRDLRAWLRTIFTPPPDGGDYARGHARATGGALVPEVYAQFAQAVLTAGDAG
jgi:single-stranded-DNA-specific exonuclease